MACAELAGLPPVTGLYATVMALLAYALFGPSRVLVPGPDSALAPLVFASVVPLIGAHGDPDKAVALASGLAVLMGIICVAAALSRLGTPAELLQSRCGSAA
jgi:MFS superfamily sulfate permease-like transporter